MEDLNFQRRHLADCRWSITAIGADLTWRFDNYASLLLITGACQIKVYVVKR
jgi:hypothetical protein